MSLITLIIVYVVSIMLSGILIIVVEANKAIGPVEELNLNEKA